MAGEKKTDTAPGLRLSLFVLFVLISTSLSSPARQLSSPKACVYARDGLKGSARPPELVPWYTLITLRLTGGDAREDRILQKNTFEEFLSYLSSVHQKDDLLLAYDTVIYIMDHTIKILLNRGQTNACDSVLKYSLEMERRILGEYKAAAQGPAKVMKFFSSIGFVPVDSMTITNDRTMRLERICDISILKDSRRILFNAINNLRLEGSKERSGDAMEVEAENPDNHRMHAASHVQLLETEMQKAASELRFEDAAKLRDALEVLRRQSSDPTSQLPGKLTHSRGSAASSGCVSKPSNDFPCTSGIRKSSNSPQSGLGARKSYHRPSPVLWPQNEKGFEGDLCPVSFESILKQAKEAMNQVAEDDLNIRQAALESEKKLRELVLAKKGHSRIACLWRSTQPFRSRQI
eukprot:252012-Hanusia_phi.AAC.3